MSIRLAASICLVPQIKNGPFLYSGDLADGCRRAAQAGFDAVEVLVPSAEEFDAALLKRLLSEHNLDLSGLGTGAGFLTHRLHLASSDTSIRRRALDYAAAIVDRAGEFGAFAVIGSLKGLVEPGVERATVLDWLCEGLHALAERAARYGVPLIVEPLNRYESNYINRLEEGVELIKSMGSPNIKLLADLFHMNIEEVSIADALRGAARHLGHVHFVDSNRRPAGCGHIDIPAVGRVLSEIGYDGFLAAEALAWPDSDGAARQTVEVFRRHVASPERITKARKDENTKCN
jgi:sugar phosphate isomerase/epimerase